MAGRRLISALVALVASVGIGTGLAMPATAQAVTGPVGTFSPSTYTFPDTYGETKSAPHVFTLTNTGDRPLITGVASMSRDDPDIDDALYISASTCDNVTLEPGQSCTVTIYAYPEFIGENSSLLRLPDNSSAGQSVAEVFVTGVQTTQGLYYPVTPARALDTRSGIGAPKGAVHGGHSVRLQLAGTHGLPPSGIAAVVLNLTVTHTTTSGHLIAYPDGTSRPGTSCLNYPPGWTGANLLTVPVSDAGAIDLYVSAGTVDLIGDVEGWYASAPTVPASYGPGRAFDAHAQTRVLDTRNVHGQHVPLAPGETRNLVIMEPAAHPDVYGVFLTVTATNTDPHASGYLSIGTVGSDLTRTSLLNLRPHTTTTNSAVVMTTPCTDPSCPPATSGSTPVKLAVRNASSKPVDVLMDTVGALYDEDLGRYRYHPRPLTRIVDTRVHLGTSRLGAGTKHTVVVPTTIATYKGDFLLATVTAVVPTRQTHVIVWNANGTAPTTSIMNPAAGTVLATNTIIGTSQQTPGVRQFAVQNYAGATDLLIDVAGAFDYYEPADPVI